MLEVKGLKKRYGAVEAVKGVSFVVRPGQCFGLLGPNGAGKSTTLEMLEQVLSPDEGEIWFDGKPVDRDFKRKLGVQFQATALPAHLKVIEVLRFYAKLYGSEKSLDALIERCQLGGFINQKHDGVSGGQRQRLMLATALCHDPEIVLLDEPTTGLDPQARRNVWGIVRSIQESGKTVVLTTHYMDEAEELCDEIAIMDHGQIISQGSPRALLAEIRKTKMIQLPREAIDGRDFVSAPWSRMEMLRSGEVSLAVSSVEETLSYLMERGVRLQGMQIREPDLEDLFLGLTGEGLRQ